MFPADTSSVAQPGFFEQAPCGPLLVVEVKIGVEATLQGSRVVGER